MEEGDERGITEARRAEVMGAQKIGEMGEQEEEIYELWGEQDVQAKQYFPSKIQVAMEDDMLMLATEQEEIYQMLSSSSHE